MSSAVIKRIMIFFLGLGFLALAVVFNGPSDGPDLEFGIVCGAVFVFFGLIGGQGWRQLFRPLSKIGFIFVGTLFTIDCCILYIWKTDNFDFHFFIAALVLILLIIVNNPIRPNFPIWKNREYMHAISYLLLAALFLILLSRFPDDLMKELLGIWYFVGILWLLFLSVLTSIFFDAKQMKNSPESTSESESNS